LDTKSKVEDHYNRNAQQEWERLEAHRTELAVTLKVLRDFLPPAPATVADIGGGPGRYAITLAGWGYGVTLVDLSSNNLALARQKALNAGVLLSATVQANALNLSQFETENFDAVLLMGPLYHLLEEDERSMAATEAVRILRSGGMMFTAFISRYAPFRWSARFDPSWYTKRRQYGQRVLRTGVHDQGTGFPNSYFAHPSEISPLMEKCGLKTLMVVGCEGVASMGEEGVNELQGAEWEAWVELNYQIGKDPYSHGAAEHLLHVGQKPA